MLRFVLYVSKIFVNAPELFLKGNSALFYHKLHEENEIAERIFSGRNPLVEEIRVSQSLQFPEARLIEYDCGKAAVSLTFFMHLTFLGKLQMLSRLLKQLHEHKHRCLIFTQMSKMLDILQSFLAYHNYQYFRLDGATPIEQRQVGFFLKILPVLAKMAKTPSLTPHILIKLAPKKVYSTRRVESKKVKKLG